MTDSFLDLNPHYKIVLEQGLTLFVCTAVAAESGDPSDYKAWYFIGACRNEIEATELVNKHAKRWGKHHRGYIVLVTPSGKVHHHVASKEKAKC